MWMERATDGTAAGAHLRGTQARLSEIDIRVVTTVADCSTPDGHESYFRKIARLTRLTLQGISHARRGRILIARYHPLLLPLVSIWKACGGQVILSVQGAIESATDNQYRWLNGSRLFYRLAIAPARMAHGLIVGAPVIEKYVRSEMLGRNAHITSIANGVFTATLAGAIDTPRPQKRPYAVFVGNLAVWQGIETLANAVDDPAWPEEVELVVIGDGTDKRFVEHNPNVRWLGRLPSAEAHTWLAHAVCAFSIQLADVSVAKHGYWPFKLIESAAAGVPVICSDAPGLVEAADKLGNALVVPAKSARSTAEAVCRLAGDEGLRSTLAEAGKKNVLAYDWSAGANEVSRLIDAVVR